MSIEVIDIVFLVMCVGILASLWQQNKQVEPLIKKMDSLEKRISSLEVKFLNKEIDIPYYQELKGVVDNNVSKINILVDRVNEMQTGKKGNK